jgi:hypothetical protein
MMPKELKVPSVSLFLLELTKLESNYVGRNDNTDYFGYRTTRGL